MIINLKVLPLVTVSKTAWELQAIIDNHAMVSILLPSQLPAAYIIRPLMEA